MAKTQKYSDELMIEAVEKYADHNKGKIVVVKLAEWASANMPGLEGISRHDFERKNTIKGKKGGKNIKEDRPALRRIHEINESRSISKKMGKNILLTSSSLDLFFQLPRPQQRQLILDTRAQVDHLIVQNATLTRKDRSLETENKLLRDENDALRLRQNEQEERISEIERKVDAAIKRGDERIRTEVLASLGISDGSFSSVRYKDSLEIKEEASINDVLSRVLIEKTATNNLLDELEDGMDF